MTSTDAIQEFGFDCKIRKLSPKTISNYQKQLKYLQRYLNSEFKITEIEDIKSIHIKQFLALKDDQRCKARYINDLLKVFKTFFNYLKKEGYIKEQPTANLKSMKQPKVKILTFNTSEIRRLLYYYNGKSFLDIRNRTMIALFFDTGMRLSEVITMEQNQIHDDFIGPTMAINSKYALVISRYISTLRHPAPLQINLHCGAPLSEALRDTIQEVLELYYRAEEARIEKKLEQRYRRVMLLVTVSVFAIGLIKQISIFNEEMIVWEIIGNFAAFGLWQIGYTHMSGMKRTKSC